MSSNYFITNDKLFGTSSNIYTHMILNYEDPGLHRHEFIEFFYCIDGQCLHYLDGSTEKISYGDAFLLTPNSEHRFENLGSKFLHRDIIFKTDYFKSVCDIYSTALYDKLYSGEYNKKIALTSQQINRLEALVQCVTLNEGADLNVYTATICTYIINAILEKNLDIQKNNYPVWVSRLLSLLSAPENFKTDQQTLISAFSYSQEYICRTFKKLIGKTITDYFNEQKMKYAYSLLHSSNYSIEQICEMINFNNTSYFYRLFKKHFNITPREVIRSTPVK